MPIDSSDFIPYLLISVKLLINLSQRGDLAERSR
jgi:hypothetical protein